MLMLVRTARRLFGASIDDYRYLRRCGTVVVVVVVKVSQRGEGVGIGVADDPVGIELSVAKRAVLDRVSQQKL